MPRSFFPPVSISYSKSWQTMSQFIGLNLQIWEAGGLASFQRSSPWLEVDTGWWTESWHFMKKRNKDEKKSVFFFFKVGFLSSAAQPRSPVRSSRWFSSIHTGYKSTESPPNDTHDPLRVSLCSLCVKKKPTAAFAQKHPLFPMPPRAAARRPCAVLTLAGCYDVRIGWASSSQLKHCRATQYN